MKTHPTPPHACPTCSHLLHRQQGLTGQQPPKRGDFTVCDGCGQILRFTEGLGVRAAGDHEVAMLSPDFRATLLTVRAHFQQQQGTATNAEKNKRRN